MKKDITLGVDFGTLNPIQLKMSIKKNFLKPIFISIFFISIKLSWKSAPYGRLMDIILGEDPQNTEITKS